MNQGRSPPTSTSTLKLAAMIETASVRRCLICAGSGLTGSKLSVPGARLMGRETLSAHPEDISTIDDVLTDALSNLGSDATKKEKAAVSTMVYRLRSFSDCLQREGRRSIMDRIGGNPAQQSSLNADYAAFSKATKRTAPLDPFREYLGLEPQQGFRPYDDDARLI
ncbi:hypothetical protein CVM73_19830 [Bradyrhizobium forestalis]|uniref:Uncharacterized protein n=1 Tax=Bradyrhizobium forestalis TaxID=1419263 RepID=A0A2M8R6I8_9BRAD|nr:hypothetical protein [Bradyrhizobium forestalis]PJG53445.1 hypothetical protein CVM73_19830 [Bradyrhizobium forestalis]